MKYFALPSVRTLAPRHTFADEVQRSDIRTFESREDRMSSENTTGTFLQGIRLNEESFTELLRQLISVSKHVQNAPSLGLIPKEDLVSDFVMKALEPYTVENGGKLQVERVSFIEGRGNLIIKYPGTGNETLAFVGSHMDVVPANPESWEVDPFELSIQGDKLYGRGTTDCLGHVAMITQLFIELAKSKVALQRTVAAVFIASEENAEIPGVGVDKLMETGKIDFIKAGPVVWIDCADSEPCMGTAGVFTWTLEARGKLFHSGLPYQGINGLELGMDALKEVQRRFYEDFPRRQEEYDYNFLCGSTLKPTNIEGSVNGLNQIPPWVKISGDARIAPFYEIEDVKAKIKTYVEDINANIETLESRGPHSKYTLPDEDVRGEIIFTVDEHHMDGIACSRDSVGHRALLEATEFVRGSVKPYSIMGSLPLVRDLQRNGFDIQLIGFGKSTVYHGDNEYCSMQDMKDALRVLCRVIENVEQ